jgi:hypothetical protein
VGENNVWSGLQLQPSQQKIYSYAGLEGPPPDYISVQDLHYTHFELPIPVTQVPYNINMLFSNDKITYEVDGLGKITYKHENPIAPTDSNFKAMGTRSTNGDGPCTVFFDNVYVLRP